MPKRVILHVNDIMNMPELYRQQNWWIYVNNYIEPFVCGCWSKTKVLQVSFNIWSRLQTPGLKWSLKRRRNERCYRKKWKVIFLLDSRWCAPAGDWFLFLFASLLCSPFITLFKLLESWHNTTARFIHITCSNNWYNGNVSARENFGSSPMFVWAL